MLALILLPFAIIGTWFIVLVVSGEIRAATGLVPIERFRALEQAQRISEVARTAEREMFEQALRRSRKP